MQLPVKESLKCSVMEQIYMALSNQFVEAADVVAFVQCPLKTSIATGIITMAIFSIDSSKVRYGANVFNFYMLV